MLGKSENISHSANLFTGFNKKYKIFSRKINSGTRTLAALLPRYEQQPLSNDNIPVTNKSKTKLTPIAIGAVNQNGLDNAIDAVLVYEFMPASVVINHQLEIVQFRGTTDLFLTHPKGKATFNILKMARPEIAFELRNAISKVIKTKHRFRKSGIEMNPDKSGTAVKIISLEIVPLNIEWDEPSLLILFTEQEQAENFWPQTEGGKNNSHAKDRRIKKLEQELAAAHTDALTIAQENEAFTEELQSASEEVVSSNEELQTVNEELETSKEEIESANEELTTTNQELQTRNDLLNEAYDYSEAVFSTIHEPLIVLDKNLRVKSANKRFYKLYNTKVEDTEGMLLYDLGNKQWNIPRLRELLEEILPRNTHFHDFEITHTFPDIGEKTMVLNARRIIQKRNHEELILLAIADVTDHLLALHKMKKNEIKLREAMESAENAVKFKQQFLSNMSHEIRTPLSSILGFTNVLLKTELCVEQMEFLQAIKTSGTSLNQLINDILDLSKVDAGRMIFEKQPFDIRKSIKSTLFSFDLKIKEKNIELIKEYDSRIPSMVLGDTVRLNQIILNLLSNAVKFTHKGEIIIRVKLLDEDDENVTIEFAVTDSGIGIAADKIDSIFNVFEQAEIGTANSYGGTGLGLAIVKQLVKAQGGSISLRSKIGEGSTFSFILSFGKTNKQSEEEIEILKLDSEIKTLRVLVAEDIVLNQLLIKIILSDFRFEYEIVGDGKVAIEKLQTNSYDIILMDLHMPVMNGFETTEYIRKTLKSQIPIIALTADVTTADISKCKEFGMDDYISKPINENLLYSKMVGLVRKQN